MFVTFGTWTPLVMRDFPQGCVPFWLDLIPQLPSGWVSVLHLRAIGWRRSFNSVEEGLTRRHGSLVPLKPLQIAHFLVGVFRSYPARYQKSVLQAFSWSG